MMQVVGTPVRVSATGAVLRTSGYLIGVLCNSSTSGTLTLRDDTAGSATPFANAIPMTAGAYIPIPAALANGLHATIGGTAADVTLFVGI